VRGQSAAAQGNSFRHLEILLRRLSDRVRRLENKAATPRPARFGQWLLEVSENGDLVATHTNGERRIVASLQEGG